MAPAESQLATKVYQECSYLQGNEGNIDPVHHSFLHLRFGEGEDSRFSWYAGDRTPTIETEETEFGVRIYAIRRIDADRSYVKVTNFIYPNLSAITGDGDGFGVNWHVPIDDTHHWKYNVTFRRTRPLARRALLRAIRTVQAGGEAPHVVRDPAANLFPGIGARKDVISSAAGWRRYWENPLADRVPTASGV